MRRASTCLALLAIAVLGVTGVANAAPTVTMKAKAVPISGFPGTGNILGAGAAVQAEFTISGTEYGGFASPLTGVNFFLPGGTKLHTAGFATCSEATLQAKGPAGCSKKSQAGPVGSASGVVSFGTERVHESLTVQPFFAPGGGLEFFAGGVTPVSIELIAKGKLLSSSVAPFGPKLVTEVPLVETVPGALDGSVEHIAVKVGAAYKKGKKTVYYGTLPKKCPSGGFPVKAELSFLSGETAVAEYKAPCPKKKK